jgi:hypothetical protein
MAQQNDDTSTPTADKSPDQKASGTCEYKITDYEANITFIKGAEMGIALVTSEIPKTKLFVYEILGNDFLGAQFSMINSFKDEIKKQYGSERKIYGFLHTPTPENEFEIKFFIMEVETMDEHLDVPQIRYLRYCYDTYDASKYILFMIPNKPGANGYSILYASRDSCTMILHRTAKLPLVRRVIMNEVL